MLVTEQRSRNVGLHEHGNFSPAHKLSLAPHPATQHCDLQRRALRQRLEQLSALELVARSRWRLRHAGRPVQRRLVLDEQRHVRRAGRETQHKRRVRVGAVRQEQRHHLRARRAGHNG
jgi:hypothetical protein